jgi:hypothetical protein
MRGQSPKERMHLIGNVGGFGGQGAQRQAFPQLLRPRRCSCAELPQADSVAAEASENLSVRARLERDVSRNPRS